jgi:hypothetical protein
MLARKHTPVAPWSVVRADDKKTARLNLIRDVLSDSITVAKTRSSFGPIVLSFSNSRLPVSTPGS